MVSTEPTKANTGFFVILSIGSRLVNSRGDVNRQKILRNYKVSIMT